MRRSPREFPRSVLSASPTPMPTPPRYQPISAARPIVRQKRQLLKPSVNSPKRSPPSSRRRRCTSLMSPSASQNMSSTRWRGRSDFCMKGKDYGKIQRVAFAFATPSSPPSYRIDVGGGMNGLRTHLNFHLASLVICAWSVIASYTAPARAETALRIASAQLSIASIPVVVAIQQKLFRAEGITAEIVDFDGGGSAGQALAGGGVDLCI